MAAGLSPQELGHIFIQRAIPGFIEGMVHIVKGRGMPIAYSDEHIAQQTTDTFSIIVVTHDDDLGTAIYDAYLGFILDTFA